MAENEGVCVEGAKGINIHQLIFFFLTIVRIEPSALSMQGKLPTPAPCPHSFCLVTFRILRWSLTYLPRLALNLRSSVGPQFVPSLSLPLAALQGAWARSGRQTDHACPAAQLNSVEAEVQC